MTAALGFVHRYLPGTTGNTLLLLHGTGGNEDDLIGLGQAVAPGWALLSPRGKVLENGMPRFFRRLAEGVFDEDDLAARAHELADFVETAAAEDGLDRMKLLALGYSNGANIASAVLLLRPQAMRGAILLRPMLPFQNAVRADLTGKSALLLCGRFDTIAPPAHGERLGAHFTACGADVERHLLPITHALSQADIALSGQWLAGLPAD